MKEAGSTSARGTAHCLARLLGFKAALIHFNLNGSL